jgi:hypothetical protein
MNGTAGRNFTKKGGTVLKAIPLKLVGAEAGIEPAGVAPWILSTIRKNYGVLYTLRLLLLYGSLSL